MNKRLQGLLSFLNDTPDDPFTLYAIALEYRGLNDHENAEKYFQEILLKDENYLPVYMQYGRFKEEIGDIPKAKELYKIGIIKAKEAGDNHAASEMQEFLDELN